jgi:hypothetical protein
MDHTDITDEDEKTRIASGSLIAEPAAAPVDTVHYP